MKNILIGLMILGVASLLLWNSNRRDKILMSIDKCVNAHVEADRYMGSLEEAWNTYAQTCSSEIK